MTAHEFELRRQLAVAEGYLAGIEEGHCRAQLGRDASVEVKMATLRYVEAVNILGEHLRAIAKK